MFATIRILIAAPKLFGLFTMRGLYSAKRKPKLHQARKCLKSYMFREVVQSFIINVRPDLVMNTKHICYCKFPGDVFPLVSLAASYLRINLKSKALSKLCDCLSLCATCLLVYICSALALLPLSCSSSWVVVLAPSCPVSIDTRCLTVCR